MVSAEKAPKEHKQQAEKEKPILCECIRIQQASTITNSDLVLGSLVVAIKRGQVNI